MIEDQEEKNEKEKKRLVVRGLGTRGMYRERKIKKGEEAVNIKLRT